MLLEVEQGKGYIRSTYTEEDEEKTRITIITDYGDFHYEKKEIITYKRRNKNAKN